jgi:hypothetical protein
VIVLRLWLSSTYTLQFAGTVERATSTCVLRRNGPHSVTVGRRIN